MNLAEYQRMYDAEERQWWYAGMRALSLALLQRAARRHGRDGPDGPDPRRGVRHRQQPPAPGALRPRRRRGPLGGGPRSSAAAAGSRRRGPSFCPCPSPTARFDCVTSLDVVYHRWVRDDAAAVREMARVLRPGGLLLLRVPALRRAVGRARRGRPLAPPLPPRRGAAPAGGRGPRGRARHLRQHRAPARWWRPGGGSTASRAARARTSASCRGPLEWAFRSVLLAEARLVKRVSFPLGSSVFALARKPA